MDEAVTRQKKHVTRVMKESGVIWPTVTEDDQDHQMTRLVATIQFGDDLSASLRERAGAIPRVSPGERPAGVFAP